MNIQKAVKQALKLGKCISNKEFPYVKLVPHNGLPFGVCDLNGGKQYDNWNPTPKELLSNKWFLVD